MASEKEFIEKRLKSDYGINIIFSEEIKPSDDVYVQIYAEDDDIKSCTESEGGDHDLKMRLDGFYTCDDCGRVFEKLNRRPEKRNH